MTEVIVCLLVALGILFCMLVSQARRIRDLEDDIGAITQQFQEVNKQLLLHAIDINHKNVTLYGQYGTLKEKRT